MVAKLLGLTTNLANEVALTPQRWPRGPRRTARCTATLEGWTIGRSSAAWLAVGVSRPHGLAPWAVARERSSPPVHDPPPLGLLLVAPATLADQPLSAHGRVILPLLSPQRCLDKLPPTLRSMCGSGASWLTPPSTASSRSLMGQRHRDPSDVAELALCRWPHCPCPSGTWHPALGALHPHDVKTPGAAHTREQCQLPILPF